MDLHPLLPLAAFHLSLEAFPLHLEASPQNLEAFPLHLEAFLLNLEAFLLNLEAFHPHQVRIRVLNFFFNFTSLSCLACINWQEKGLDKMNSFLV